MNDLVFERTQEAFSHSVVIAVALAAHTAWHPVFFEQRQIAGGGRAAPTKTGTDPPGGAQ